MRILKFQAAWCTPCKNLSKMMEGMPIPFYVEEINIDEDREASLLYGIRTVPTLILMDEDNNVVKRVSGIMTKEQLTDWIIQ